MTIIGDIFTMEERARIQGLFSSVWGFVSLLGPAIGGVIVDGASWRFAFLLNIPLGLASMLLISRYFQERTEKRQTHVIDYWGTVLLSGAVGALLLSVLQSVKTYGWLGAPTLGLFAISAVLLALFIRQEGRAEEPVLPMWLFRNKVIVAASICTFVSGAGRRRRYGTAFRRCGPGSGSRSALPPGFEASAEVGGGVEPAELVPASWAGAATFAGFLIGAPLNHRPGIGTVAGDQRQLVVLVAIETEALALGHRFQFVARIGREHLLQCILERGDAPPRTTMVSSRCEICCCRQAIRA